MPKACAAARLAAKKKEGLHVRKPRMMSRLAGRHDTTWFTAPCHLYASYAAAAGCEAIPYCLKNASHVSITAAAQSSAR